MGDRTCVACRTRRPAALLRRLTASREGLVALSVRGSGRGAWVCADGACLRKLESRPRALSRALRHVEVGPAAVRGLAAQVREEALLRVRASLVRCARAGAVASGSAAVTAALQGGDVVAIILATDASALHGSAARDALGAEGVVSDVGLDRAALGRLLGRGPRAVLAVRAGRPGSLLVSELRCRWALG